METRIIDDGKLRVTQAPEEIHQAIADKKHIWVELQRKDHACDVLLAEQLQLHPLTIEDIWADVSQPKLEDYDRYLYLIIHGIGALHEG
jgi:Mg2+ and Co2+ transporter CorA